mgnify:CR=1 FL=1
MRVGVELEAYSWRHVCVRSWLFCWFCFSLEVGLLIMFIWRRIWLHLSNMRHPKSSSSTIYKEALDSDIILRRDLGQIVQGPTCWWHRHTFFLFSHWSSSGKISNRLHGFLKLDGVEVEGEAKVQRKIEVRRVHGITYRPFNTSYLGFIQCHYQLGSFWLNYLMRSYRTEWCLRLKLYWKLKMLIKMLMKKSFSWKTVFLSLGINTAWKFSCCILLHLVVLESIFFAYEDWLGIFS